MSSTTDSPAAATPLPFGLLDLALLGVAVIWGANFVVIKSAVSQFEPLAFTALRFTLATLVMAAASTPRFTLPRLSRAVWVQLGLLAIVGNVLYQPMATLGLNYTTTTNAALIVSSAPAWVAVLGHVFGVDRLSARAWFGVALSAVGLALVVAGDGTGLSLAPQNMLGNLFSLLAALGWAGSTLMMRPLVLRYSPHSVVVLSNLLATPALLLIAVPGFRSQDWGALTPTGWLQLVFSALLAICLAYLLWAKGVQRLGAARTALYGNLAVQVVGAALVIVGIGLARQK